VDAAGDAFVIGDNPGVPTTANAIASSGSGQDFVAELNPTGSGLLYSTYLPGTVNYNFNIDTLGFSGAIAVDGSGNIDVAGAAGAGLPVTADAFQPAYLGGNGGYDAFFAKINPTLSASASLLYSTYLGGSSGADQASGIAVDGAGNAYVTGITASGNFPTTRGAFQSSLGGGYDVFVTKFNPALSGAASLVYSTYLGGNTIDGYAGALGAIEYAQTNGGIAVDSAGNAYVTGGTASVNFPTTPGAFQVKSSLSQSSRTFAGPCDAFVTKLNATGTALVYSTYLGSGTTSQSSGTSIAVDANGDAYLSGWTNATAFPTTNPVQATNSGGYDAFVTALNPSGSSLLFSSYLGGSGNDFAYGIGLDSAGNVYVAGGAGSSNFPTTTGSGFVSKITPIVSLSSLSVTGFSSPTTAGVPGSITLTALNANGTVNTGYTGTVHFTSSDPQAVLPPDYTFTAADQGTHTFNVTLDTAGTQSLTATDAANGLAGSESGITVNPAAASTLSLTGYPSPTNASLAGSFTVTALDPFGNKATGYSGTVHFTSSDSLASLPADYTFTTADNGTHTFSATLNTTGAQSLTATDTATGTITGSQTGIMVYPASLPAVSFSVTGFPTSITAGVAGTITVTARDTNGNIANSYRGTVHFTGSDPLAVLPPDYTFTGADQGVHTFSVTLKKAGGQSIAATDTATCSISASETGISVQPAAASQFVLSAPSSVTKGSAFSLTLTVEDAFGNVVIGYVGTVHFTSSDSTASLQANYTFTAGDAGVHTFVSKAILRKRGTQTITVTDTQNSALTATDSVNVT
jgi:hypothetical protein